MCREANGESITLHIYKIQNNMHVIHKYKYLHKIYLFNLMRGFYVHQNLIHVYMTKFFAKLESNNKTAPKNLDYYFCSILLYTELFKTMHPVKTKTFLLFFFIK